MVAVMCECAGNVIEWQYPKDIDLSGIEFKAMASGSHNVDSDIVFVPCVLRL
jgi:hypothetical protein